MIFLCNGNRCKYIGDFRKSFLACSFCKLRVHAGVFVVFATSGFFQVLCRCPDDAGREAGRNFNVSAFEHFKEPFGVFAFMVGGFFKNGRNLHIALFLGL